MDFWIVGFSVINMILLITVFLRCGKGDVEIVKNRLESFENNQERTERGVREEISRNREEASGNAQKIREELNTSINAFGKSFFARFTEVSTMQKNQLDTFSHQLSILTWVNEEKLERLRDVIETRLKSLQEDNVKQLDKMRETVDEKLHATLEKRLGESFKNVSERLEKVHQGLGAMQSLASGVGDLKKVLTNVKTRGIWGEVQLENLLEQVLTVGQYEKNVVTKKNSRDSVEFAIKLPGHDDGSVFLPIDAKFPLEDYQRLLEAQDQADVALVEEFSKAIENRIKLEAKNIRDKYIDPPRTTDFAILFLPIEGLYAEVLRRPGFCEELQRKYRITVAGPTTITALLNSLQMGFRTLAVEKSAGKVWQLLGTVKTEFGAFGDILDKTQKKLQEASNTMEKASSKSRNIERKLHNVHELSMKQAQKKSVTHTDEILLS